MPKFYGYKRCSISKKAQNQLDDYQIACQYQNLVEKPPKQEKLPKWLTDFQDCGLRYSFNTSGRVCRQMHLEGQINKMTLEEVVELLPQNGKLIKGPLVIDGKKLACGLKKDIYEKTWL